MGEDITVLPTSRRVVALTFDAGSSDAAVGSILRTLAAKRVPATFFLTGDFVRRYPGQSRAIAAAYPVGNHTMTHPDLTALSNAGVVDQVRDAEAAIRSVTGTSPKPLFRFPYGARDARTLRLVNAECYVAFRWTVDTLGWKGTSGGQSVATVRSRVLAAAQPGEIVLMHVGANPDDGSTLDADALASIIDALRARGYGFTTLRAALGS